MIIPPLFLPFLSPYSCFLLPISYFFSHQPFPPITDQRPKRHKEKRSKKAKRVKRAKEPQELSFTISIIIFLCNTITCNSQSRPTTISNSKAYHRLKQLNYPPNYQHNPAEIPNSPSEPPPSTLNGRPPAEHCDHNHHRQELSQTKTEQPPKSKLHIVGAATTPPTTTASPSSPKSRATNYPQLQRPKLQQHRSPPVTTDHPSS